MHPPFLTWVAATRPAFLSVTIAGVCLGLASSIHDHTFWSISLALITLMFALIAHAGANVINDYYDALSGCDAANTDRIPPFTGGSRFIQNGLLSTEQTRLFGYSLLGIVIPAGAWLVLQSGQILLWIGLAGLFCGWSYSANPLKLQSRGLGEFIITLAWLCVVLGSAYVQSRMLNTTALYAGLTYAPLVANVLFVNQIPDRIADAAAGKKTLIVRCDASISPWGSLTLYTLAMIALLLGMMTGALPSIASLALIALIPAAIALRALFRNPTDSQQLRIAIPATIITALLFGTLLSVMLIS